LHGRALARGADDAGSNPPWKSKTAPPARIPGAFSSTPFPGFEKMPGLVFQG
jgi:hypothetical protein